MLHDPCARCPNRKYQKICRKNCIDYKRALAADTAHGLNEIGYNTHIRIVRAQK